MARTRTGDKRRTADDKGGRPRELGDEGTQNVVVRMPMKLYERLKSESDDSGMAMNEIIRRAVVDWLDS